jgi:hypothetical protein
MSTEQTVADMAGVLVTAVMARGAAVIAKNS